MVADIKLHDMEPDFLLHGKKLYLVQRLVHVLMVNLRVSRH